MNQVLKESVLRIVQQHENPPPKPNPYKGLYEYEYAFEHGELKCYLEYSARCKPSDFDPGEPEEINLMYALANGLDITEMLREGIKELIEEGALNDMERRAMEDCDEPDYEPYDRAYA